MYGEISVVPLSEQPPFSEPVAPAPLFNWWRRIEHALPAMQYATVVANNPQAVMKDNLAVASVWTVNLLDVDVHTLRSSGVMFDV